METNKETVEQVYAEAMQTTGVFLSRQTYAKRYLAAHKRGVAAKDAEIASLRSLIKELVDNLNAIVESDDGICDCNCGKEYECTNKSTVCFPHIRALVKKAREVYK